MGLLAQLKAPAQNVTIKNITVWHNAELRFMNDKSNDFIQRHLPHWWYKSIMCFR